MKFRKTEKQEFLSLHFNYVNKFDFVFEVISEAKTDGYKYMVTPNVDHVVSINDERHTDLKYIYNQATYTICDSKILALLGSLIGRHLDVMPGSDLTEKILKFDSFDCQIAVIGPTEQDFIRLQSRFPKLKLSLINAPQMLIRNSADWKDCVNKTLTSDWDLLFICLSHPKQEYFAHELKNASRANGLGLCVGASIDFLIGKQKRAPIAIQKLKLEWLYRLMSNPRRLMSRYLVRGPRIFYIFFLYVFSKRNS